MAARYAFSAVQSTTLGQGSAVVKLRGFDGFVELDGAPP